MARWEYKTLYYGLKGRRTFTERFWVDTSESLDESCNRYRPTARSRLIGKVQQAMRQLEEALNELDEEGWELVSSSYSSGVFRLDGMAVVRRARKSDTGS